MEPQKTFWGLAIEQGKQYKQTPTFNFHVSRAVLDLENYDKKPISLRVQVDNGEFVLCNLNENETQAHLDLIFSEGEKVKFFTTGGKGNVHLTGYLMPEEDLSQFDEEFSDEDVSDDDQVVLNPLNQMKRKNTETVKLAGKDSKKMKTEDKASEVNAKQKVVDVDPKQLLNKKENKQQDNQQNKKKEQQQTKDKVAMNNKLATKGLEMDSDSDEKDDDLSSIDEDESLDLNAMMDEESDLNDEDLESNDDLESDDEDDIDIAKLNKIKNQTGKPNVQQANKPKQQPQNAQKNKNQQQKQQNGQFNQNKQNKTPQQQMNKNQQNKSPQQMNKNQQNTPNQNKNQEKPHQQTPFQHKKGQNNDFKKNSNKKNQGTPFQSGNKGNKSFGSQNKQAKKVFN